METRVLYSHIPPISGKAPSGDIRDLSETSGASPTTPSTDLATRTIAKQQFSSRNPLSTMPAQKRSLKEKIRRIARISLAIPLVIEGAKVIDATIWRYRWLTQREAIVRSLGSASNLTVAATALSLAPLFWDTATKGSAREQAATVAAGVTAFCCTGGLLPALVVAAAAGYTTCVCEKSAERIATSTQRVARSVQHTVQPLYQKVSRSLRRPFLAVANLYPSKLMNRFLT